MQNSVFRDGLENFRNQGFLIVKIWSVKLSQRFFGQCQDWKPLVTKEVLGSTVDGEILGAKVIDQDISGLLVKSDL